MLHNFSLNNFSLLFPGDFQANPTDISSKKQWKIIQSKIMQHSSYLGCPLETPYTNKYIGSNSAIVKSKKATMGSIPYIFWWLIFYVFILFYVESRIYHEITLVWKIRTGLCNDFAHTVKAKRDGRGVRVLIWQDTRVNCH